MNSIEGMKCPECGHTESFDIEVGVFCEYAECGSPDCGFAGTVKDFKDTDAQPVTETAKHTPGPWKLRRDRESYWFVMAEGASQVALIGMMTVAPGAPDANARLIAAAPDYHAAAQLAQDSQGPSDNEHVVISREAYGALFDAHAKAEGRPTE